MQELSDLPESFQSGVTYVYYMRVGADIRKESEQTFMKLWWEPWWFTALQYIEMELGVS